MALSDGLIGHWPFDSATIGSASIFEVGGNGLHGINSGVTDGGGYASCNGSQSVSCVLGTWQAAQKRPSAITIVAQVWQDSYNQGHIFSTAGNLTTARSLQAYIATNGSARLILSSDGSNITATTASAPAIIPTGQWVWVAWQWDGSLAWVRVNDAYAATSPFSGSLYDAGKAPRLLDTFHGDPFTGRVKNMAVWNRALSEAELDQVFAGATLPRRAVSSARPVILLGGQSNAEGGAPIADLSDPVAADRHSAHWIASTGNEVWAGHFNHVWPGFNGDLITFGPEVGMAQVLPDDWVILKYGRGGTYLDHAEDDWYPGDSVWNNATTFWDAQLADLATFGDTPDIRAFVWIQGMADSTASSYANAYGTNLTALIAAARVAYGANLPFYVLRQYDFGTSYYSVVRGKQVLVAQAVPRVSLVDTQPWATFVPGHVHYDTPSMLKVGRLMGAMIAGSPVPSDLPQARRQYPTDPATIAFQGPSRGPVSSVTR